MEKYSLYKALMVTVILLLTLCACTSGSDQDGNQAPLSVAPTQAEALKESADVSFAPEQPPNDIGDGNDPAEHDAAPGELVITFDYEKQSGVASNQFAVWIEDADGLHVKTLYATRFTANGGYKNRPDSIPVWVEKSGLAAMSDANVDAITSATPKAGTLEYTWDLKDESGEAVPNGEYEYFVEGTLRWKNQVLYSGVITIAAEPSVSEAVTEYTFEGGGNQPALTEVSPEVKMLGSVTALFR